MSDEASTPLTEEKIYIAFVKDLEEASDAEALIRDYAARYPRLPHLAEELGEMAGMQKERTGIAVPSSARSAFPLQSLRQSLSYFVKMPGATPNASGLRDHAALVTCCLTPPRTGPGERQRSRRRTKGRRVVCIRPKMADARLSLEDFDHVRMALQEMWS
jgi:hypothetical protein